MLTLSSCSNREMDILVPQELTTTINLNISKPSKPQVRTQTTTETTISEVSVLAFENGVYKYTANGKNITQSVASGSFNVTLHKTSNSLDLFVLVNCNTAINANPPSVGDTKAAVASKLTNAFTANGISSNFPMFGSYSSASGINTLVQNTLTVNLIRHVARVDIDASATSNFTLVSARLYRANNSTQLIPSSLTSNSSVSSPSVPSASSTNITSNSHTITSNVSSAQIYVSEATAPSNVVTSGTCLIIGGYYNGSSTLSYYRLDFDPQVTGHPNGQILRNYIYKFSLQAVYSSGYSTETAAATNSTQASTYSVKVWNSSTLDMVYNGFYYLGISNNPASIMSSINSTASVGVETNLTSYSLQWASDAAGTPSGTAASSLNDGVFSVAQTNGGNTLLITALTQNSTSANINRYVLISGNGLSLVLSFSQSPFSINPSPITLSASGGNTYALVKSLSLWAPFSDQSWLTLSRTSGSSNTDTLKINSTTNPTTSPRTGTITLKLLDGSTNTVAYTQSGQNTTSLKILSWNNSYGYLGTDLTVATAEATAQGYKGIIVNTANFGSVGTVNLGTPTITGVNANNVTVPAGTNIVWLAIGALTSTSADAIYTWLTTNPNAVLILNFGQMNNSYLMGRLGVTGGATSGTAGAFPVQYNSNTSYFTTSGPFTTYPYTALSSNFSMRNRDGTHAELPLATNSQIIPIMKGSDGGILLGIDKTRRVLYIGDVDIMNTDPGTGATTNNYIQNTSGTINNDASKLMANVWAWVVLTAQGKAPI